MGLDLRGLWKMGLFVRGRWDDGSGGGGGVENKLMFLVGGFGGD